VGGQRVEVVAGILVGEGAQVPAERRVHHPDPEIRQPNPRHEVAVPAGLDVVDRPVAAALEPRRLGVGDGQDVAIGVPGDVGDETIGHRLPHHHSADPVWE